MRYERKRRINPCGVLWPVAALFREHGDDSEDDWVDDLDPIQPAALGSRAREASAQSSPDFGGTPEDIDRLATSTWLEAERRIIDYEKVENDLPAFAHSGVYDPTLKVFPPSRPATTRKAETTGEAIGVR